VDAPQRRPVEVVEVAFEHEATARVTTRFRRVGNAPVARWLTRSGDGDARWSWVRAVFRPLLRSDVLAAVGLAVGGAAATAGAGAWALAVGLVVAVWAVVLRQAGSAVRHGRARAGPSTGGSSRLVGWAGSDAGRTGLLRVGVLAAGTVVGALLGILALTALGALAVVVPPSGMSGGRPGATGGQSGGLLIEAGPDAGLLAPIPGVGIRSSSPHGPDGRVLEYDARKIHELTALPELPGDAGELVLDWVGLWRRVTAELMAGRRDGPAATELLARAGRQAEDLPVLVRHYHNRPLTSDRFEYLQVSGEYRVQVGADGERKLHIFSSSRADVEVFALVATHFAAWAGVEPAQVPWVARLAVSGGGHGGRSGSDSTWVPRTVLSELGAVRGRFLERVIDGHRRPGRRGCRAPQRSRVRTGDRLSGRDSSARRRRRWWPMVGVRARVRRASACGVGRAWPAAADGGVRAGGWPGRGRCAGHDSDGDRATAPGCGSSGRSERVVPRADPSCAHPGPGLVVVLPVGMTALTALITHWSGG
jgi:hypothetical protein